MTLKKLAEITGTSVGTVSKAFSGSPEISLETREKIYAVAKENGCCSGGYETTDSRRAGMSPYPSVFYSISQRWDTW